MADKSKTIIVKKVKKHHAEAHGGSWKVAYADFVTAMMAFFLLLWLLAMVSPEKRAAVSDYFNHYNLFKESGRSFMEQSSGIKQEIKTTSEAPATGAISLREVQQKIKTSMDNNLKGLQSQVLIEQVEGGIRIQLIDLDGKPMFRSGSAVPTERCKQLLMIVTEAIKDAKVMVAIEGHTDAAISKKGREINWELSTARASFARKMIESDGFNPENISKVSGFADTALLVKENPADARNRRLSLILSPIPEKKEEAAPKPDDTPQSLSIIPPSVAPAPTAAKPEDVKPATAVPAKEDDKVKVIDSGITTKKPIFTPIYEKKSSIQAPQQKQRPQQKQNTQPLSIIPPSVTPAPAAAGPEEIKPAAKKTAPKADSTKKSLIDPGITPKKPIDVRPTLFPGMNQ